MKTQLIIENEDLLVFETELFTIQILGGIKYSQLDALRTTLRVSKKDFRTIRQSVNLYNQKAVDNLLELIADGFDFETTKVDYIISELIEQLEQFRLSKLDYLSKPEQEQKQLTDKEIKEAKKYLSSSDLMEVTMIDIGKSGVMGEEINRLLMLMVFTSRKLKHPLNVVSLSPSGSGKSHLQDAVAKLIPTEDKIEITTLTKNAFYYLKDIDKKLILIEDLTGVESSMYPIREIQSKGKLTKTITGKDAKGNPKSVQHVLEGKVCVSSTGTKESLYTDNESRSIVIHIDGSEDQDKRIVDYQRKSASGTVDKKQENQIQQLFRNCQRILKPVEIRNPFAQHLSLPSQVSKIRRTYSIYLGLIESICFYHQYQRKVCEDKASKISYIEVTPEDIHWANKLFAGVLVSKSDELNDATRKCFENIKKYLALNAVKVFTGKEIRLHYRVPNGTLKRYIKTLLEYGYIKIAKGNRYKGYEYAVIEQEEVFTDLKGKISSQLQQQLLFIQSKEVA